MREHHGCYGASTTGRLDHAPKCGDLRRVGVNPPIEGCLWIIFTQAGEELDANLFEFARKPHCQQPFPLIDGDETGKLALRPVKTKRLAQSGVRSSELRIVGV